MSLRKSFRQIVAVTGLSLATLGQRRAASLVIVVGTACVVAVLLAMLAMSGSLIRTMENAGRADRAIVLRKNASSESNSSIPRSALLPIRDAPGVQRATGGVPVVSAEALFAVNVPKKSDGMRTELLIRGVSAEAFALRPEVRMVSGRMPNSGMSELIVGRAASTQYRGLELGQDLRVRGGAWRIVGVFEANGTARESELFGDVEALLSAFQRNSFNSATAQLQDAASLETFRNALESNPAVSLSVLSEAEYYQQHSRRLGNVLRLVAYLIGGIMAVGAVFGALNTMYSAVSARAREIATLRAIGFKAPGIVISVMAESLGLALIGALAGAALVWWLCNGLTFSTRPGGGYHLVVQMKLDLQLVILGVVWASTIALVGALAPALRAARMPVATALRET
jgi:putative ABC transport system permease protein